MKKSILFYGLCVVPFALDAQQLPQEGYIDWGKEGMSFPRALEQWEKGQPLYGSEDDNFFISRVKPKLRFVNQATQVNQTITPANDKKLLFWVPINDTPNNALPDGVFDSEVFPMWSYITHYGNWTAPFVRMPGNFADVAHKNGVGVSVLAGIPWLNLTPEWQEVIQVMQEQGSDKMADLLAYYGIDGLGYNSEFDTDKSTMDGIINYHKELHAKLKTSGRMPLYQMSWYDGTNDEGNISFDQGLGTHNDGIFGTGEETVSSFFLNYNWNKANLLQRSVEYARTTSKRDPLDLFAGVNMQGGQPGYNSWTLLKDYPISVGLWGAHSQNMFFESRGEKGAQPETQQRTYLQRVERYFTGGTRNPVNTPEVSDMMSYNADNFEFFGMSKLMSAKSSLSWDLSEEPFVSHFNLGNGRFFNWNGERQSSREWYNIGIQDYLPTWRWWFADEFLGRTADAVPQNGLDAEFVWDDAWMGGSLMRVFGTSANEYLHLFKTQFELKSGDEITVRYKVMGGNTDLSLALSAEGNESEMIVKDRLTIVEGSTIHRGEWIEKKFVLRGGLGALANKTLAMVALHFENAADLNLYLGEFSIKRGSYAAPAMPVIASTTALASTHEGVDGKIIFNMENQKPLGEPCYNIDVNTSVFKLYAQQEGKDPIVMGATTSWAGMYYAVPFDYTASNTIRFGVSAVSLDMESESEIAWGEYQEIGNYRINDNVSINKGIIKPTEDFEISFVDPLHEPSKWEILNQDGEVLSQIDGALGIDMPEGLAEIGSYNLRITGKVARPSTGERVDSTRVFSSFIQITSTSTGAIPKILTVTCDDSEENTEVSVGQDVVLKYTGRRADGVGSRAVDLKENAFGFKASDMEMQPHKSFSVAFWLKFNVFNGETQLMNVRDKKEGWPKTDWGWLWNTVSQDGSFRVTFRGSDGSNNKELSYQYQDLKMAVGPWTHYAYVFEYNEAQQMRFRLYINGKEIQPSKWDRLVGGSAVETGTDNTKFHGDVYGMRGANMIAIGGPAHGRAGVDGALDHFQYWNKAMTTEEVAMSMDNIAEKPAELYGYWDIETDPNEENSTFTSTGAKAVAAGMHGYAAGQGEGEGDFTWSGQVGFFPGCPFVEGTAYRVETKAEWNTKGDLASATCSDTDGSATVSFEEEGQQTVTLSLVNSWGRDTKELPYILVTDGNSIDESKLDEVLSAYPNPFKDVVTLRFAAAGDYLVKVFDMTGRQVTVLTKQVAAGDFVQLNLDVAPGQYNALIYNKKNELVQAVRLIKN